MEFELRMQVNRCLHRVRESKPVFDVKVEGANDAVQFCELRMASAEREEFMVMYLNSQHGLIKDIVEFKGTINSAAVYPREIAKRCLELNAAAVILCHNHPSGETSPSDADIHITEQIAKALALFDINVLDHIIVGSRGFSLAQSGKMPSLL